MTRWQGISRFVALLAAILALSIASSGFGVLDQGESRILVGQALIGAAKVGVLGLAAAIACAAVKPRWSLHLLWLSALAVVPLYAFLLFPSLWCLLLDCGRRASNDFLQPGALMLFGSLAIAIGGMWLSKPQ